MKWSRFFRRSKWDDERRRELESYIEIETDANIEQGPGGEAGAFFVRARPCLTRGASSLASA